MAKKSVKLHAQPRTTFPSNVRPPPFVRLRLAQPRRDSPAIHPVIQHTQPGMLHTGDRLLQTMKPVQTRHLHNNRSSQAALTEKKYGIREKGRMLVCKYSIKTTLKINKKRCNLEVLCRFMSGAFHMEAVQHPQIHLSRTSPLGVRFEGTTAQIGTWHIHVSLKIQHQLHFFSTIHSQILSRLSPQPHKARWSIILRITEPCSSSTNKGNRLICVIVRD